MGLAYEVQWKATKKDFEKLTGKKKPAEKTLGIFRKSTKIEDTLKKVDKTFALLSGSKDLKTDLSNYDKSVLVYKKESEAYIKLLESALGEDKDADSAYGKAIVMLKKQLKAMLVTMNTMGGTYANELKDMTATEKVIDIIVPATQSGLKKMSAFLAKVAAQKTPEDQVKTFNSGIMTATRDITQNIKNAMTFQKKGMVQWKGKNLDGLVKVMTAWANDGRVLPANADETAIKRELNALAQTVKGVKEWVKDNS